VFDQVFVLLFFHSFSTNSRQRTAQRDDESLIGHIWGYANHRYGEGANMRYIFHAENRTGVWSSLCTACECVLAATHLVRNDPRRPKKQCRAFAYVQNFRWSSSSARKNANFLGIWLLFLASCGGVFL